MHINKRFSNPTNLAPLQKQVLRASPILFCKRFTSLNIHSKLIPKFNIDNYSPMSQESQVKPVPDNKIIAYAIPGVDKDLSSCIRPCKPTRQWMDDTPGRYAYRCIPLTAANTLGWEILNPIDVELIWHKSEDKDEIQVKTPKPDPFAPHPHFGSGTVTWYLPFLFRTPAEYGMVIAGPANHDKADIIPLDAFVRTDWVPFPFTMNWRITTPNKPIVFKAGEPICRLYPYPLALLNNMEMELHDMSEDPAFMQKVNNWNQQRQQNYQQKEELEQQWAEEGEIPDIKEMWNTQYARGKGSDHASEEHQNIFKCKDMVDKRDK